MIRPGVSRLKIWLAILSVFALGCITGASLDSAYRLRAHGEERGKRNSEATFERMKSDLDLDDRQATEIRQILDLTRNNYRALRSEVRPRYDALRQDSRARIRALLTPEQQQRFDRKVAERDARRNNDERMDKDGH
jgi:Spy/CpxP family protein refolding chaperone